MKQVEIKAPEFPESIADGEVALWHKGPGEACTRDEVLVEIETDKIVLEIAAPADGCLVEVFKAAGETVLSEEVLATFAAGKMAAGEAVDIPDNVPHKAVADMTGRAEAEFPPPAGPAARKAARELLEERQMDTGRMVGTGQGGRITREDVVGRAARAREAAAATPADDASQTLPGATGMEQDRVARRVPMTRLRASIARRLVESRQTTAMLTTFNEVDMQAIMDLRRRYREEFERVHQGTRLGLMSFFVRASIEALKRFPSVNASIDGNDIVYHGYQDIGVAVNSPRGLVVPVLRDADGLSFAEIESRIGEFGTRALEGKLTIEEMQGGTFTLSNGGVFGSLLSTPILNPPQTGILGMHKIQERPVALDGELVIRPMMYLALSYDHRLIDGQEAVGFLVTIKDLLEQPARMLLDI